MTAPRMISAEEARTLTEAATPGPWSTLPIALDPIGPDRIVRVRIRDVDCDLVTAAHHLAATVIELHAEVERLRSDDYAQARRIADAAIAAERARILALLTERADATREHDGRESVVSATYRKAASLITALVTP